MLIPGDPIPSFYACGVSNPRYSFDSVAGRHIVLSFIASTSVPGVEALLEGLYGEDMPFDDDFASLFLVSCDPADEQSITLVERYPGIRIFRDYDQSLARLFGCVAPEGEGNGRLSLTSWIIDPGLRVLDVLPVGNPATHAAAIREVLSRRAGWRAEAASAWAPVLMVPNVLEPEFCRTLIDYCEAQGAEESGYMKTDPATGQTVMVVDHNHKRRSDCNIDDEDLRGALQARIRRRLVPAIERAFQFKATRMERYLIARYDAGSGGYFRPHKDNTTQGTAHRRFAVSLGLDAESYEGGDLRFPEFGPRTYRPPTGGAVVFSCSLLHEAMPVTSGLRYAVLPFLYDEAAAKLRLENAQYLQDAELRKNVIASVKGGDARQGTAG